MGIIYDDEDHSYRNESGKAYVSVTQLLHRMGLAPDYSAVDPEVLRKAAEAGTALHREIERALLAGETIDLTEPLAKWGLLASEQMAGDDQYMIAGTYDLLMTDPEGRISLVDIKCTSTPPKDYCGWQCSIYRRLLALPEDTPLWMLYVDKKAKQSQLIRMQSHPDAEVIALFEAYRNGKPFAPFALSLASESELAGIATASELAERLKAAEDAVKAVKQRILQHMIDNGISSYEQNGWRFAAVAGSVRKSLDAKRLQAELPSVYEEYLKESQTAPSLRIARAKGGK